MKGYNSETTVQILIYYIKVLELEKREIFVCKLLLRNFLLDSQVFNNESVVRD